MNFDKIMQTILLVGVDTPAYKALFDQIISTMHSDDQAALQKAYDQALDGAAKAHAAAQED